MKRDKLEDLIKDNQDIIYDKYFFDSLKSTSLLVFRKNINMVQDIKPSLYLEEQVDKYYVELLSQYDTNSQLFYIYNKLLDDFKNKDYSFLDNYHDFNYFIDRKMKIRLQDYKHYGDREELVSKYLIKHTSQKISEIVVDGLFKDNIYNVWLNIKEMMRYCNALVTHEKILNEKSLKFYQDILNIDKMSNEDKITLYHDFKNRNLALQLYEDWIKIRKHSYDSIKDALFCLDNQNNLLNDKETNKYKVPIYELNGEDFYMVVSCRDGYLATDIIRRYCYSLISSYNMEVFSKQKFIYGYTDFNSKDILHIFESDIASSGKFDSNSMTTHIVNRIMTPFQLTSFKGYNEIQIINKKIDRINDSFETIRPSYLVVFDDIEERHIIEAKNLNIPIIKIDTSKYISKINKGIQYRNHLNFDKFDYIHDVYSNGSTLENEKRSKR